jgi:hypothetical protein
MQSCGERGFLPAVIILASIKKRSITKRTNLLLGELVRESPVGMRPSLFLFPMDMDLREASKKGSAFHLQAKHWPRAWTRVQVPSLLLWHSISSGLLTMHAQMGTQVDSGARAI